MFCGSRPRLELRRCRRGWWPGRSGLLSLALVISSCGGAGEDDPFSLDADTPVVVIVIDTLRADHLSCYGYPLETSPILDELASRSFVFEANSTQCNTTFPSLTSIFTGVYPKTHGNYLAVPIEGTAASGGGLRCAAERFGDLGLYTAAATSHPSWGTKLDPDATLWRGWDAISHLGEPIPIEDRPLFARAENTNERLFKLIDEYDAAHAEKPLFLWAHYFDPHTDLRGNLYDPPEELANLYLDHHLSALGLEEHAESLRPLGPIERNEWIKKNHKHELRYLLYLAVGRAGYDAEITSCDGRLQDLFDRLQANGVLDEALLIVMADHGENMEENSGEREAHPFTHRRLYESVSHTPLLIHFPGQTEGKRFTSITQNIDILPTLMELFDMPLDLKIEGKSLVPLLRGDVTEVHQVVFIESSVGREKAVRSEEFKFIDGWRPDESELYDWRNDRDELNNLVETLEEGATAQLAGVLDKFRPEVTLRIRCVPMEQPYDLQIQALMPGTRIKDVQGVPADSISEDKESFTWAGSVGPEGLEISLHPRIYRNANEVRWIIEHSGRDDLSIAVQLGKVPVSYTPAIPIWKLGGAAPADLPYSIFEDGKSGLTRIQLTQPGAQHFECEVRYAMPRYDQHLLVERSVGFEERFPPESRHHRTDAYGVDEALLELRPSNPAAPRYYLLRIDGTWPAADKLSVNGRVVDTETLQFMFPAIPKDLRIYPYLSAGPSPDEKLPPGTIVIWQESGGGSGEIDAGHLSRELADQLNSIGYLGEDD